MPHHSLRAHLSTSAPGSRHKPEAKTNMTAHATNALSDKNKDYDRLFLFVPEKKNSGSLCLNNTRTQNLTFGALLPGLRERLDVTRNAPLKKRELQPEFTF